MKTEGKVIVVTGAGSGIGRELALLLLSRGARVAGVDVNGVALAETVQLAGNLRDRFEGLAADITNRSAVEELPGQVIARFGAVDGLINNAGIIQPFARLNDLDYASIERVLNVNLLGSLFAIKSFLPRLLQRPEAHIVNLSSMGGFVPVPGQTIYCAAKAGVKLMSEGLGSELLGTMVKVTVVFPGAIATNIRENSGLGASPLSASSKRTVRALRAQRAAEIIVAAMERNAYNVFVGRDAWLMDKLYRFSPRLAVRAIASRMSATLAATPGVMGETN